MLLVVLLVLQGRVRLARLGRTWVLVLGTLGGWATGRGRIMAETPAILPEGAEKGHHPAPREFSRPGAAQ